MTEERKFDKCCRRLVQYYILAIIAATVFYLISIGPISDWIDNNTGSKKYITILVKSLIIFCTVFIIDRLITNNIKCQNKIEEIVIE